MKYKKLFTALLAAAAMLTACKQEKDYTLPEIKVSVPGLDFEAASSSSTVTVNATRDWKVSTEADWISISPDSGKANEEQTVTVTVLGNEGFNREAKLKFDITYDNRTVVLKQKGPAGAIEDAIVFYNNFDKEAATQTYGSGTSWPYLDQFDGWKNQTGTGVAAVSYGFNSISARNNSNSNGNYSDYEGSGLNNLLFGTDAYLRVSGIALGTGRNYTLSFGTEKYLQNSDNTFKPSEFHVYISADGQKWVELEYKFPGEFKDGRWDLASSTFTLPDGVTTLGIHVKSDLASGHRMDDLKLVYSLDPGTVIDFSTGIDIPVSDSGGGDTPSGDTSLAKIIAAANNTDVETAEVLVVAKYARGVMLQEGDDHLLVYDANGVDAKIGDKVVVKGKKATYSGQAQITTPTVTVKSSGNTVTYPTVKVLDASNFASFTSNVPVYIQYVGTLVQSGNYLNVTIPGVEGKDGSIAYPAEDYSAFYNKEVKVTGFYLGGQTHYSTMVVKLEATDGSGGGSGGDTGTGQTFSTIAGLANDADVETNEVLVVGKHARGAMLQEGSAYMLAFDANGVNANVGDKVVVTGKKGTYSGMAQITSPSVTVKSTGNTVTYPTPKVLDATNFATYTATAPEYIQYTGKLVKSGNYLNVTIPGVEGKDGSIAYPIGSYDEFVDKNVTVSGFFVGGSTHYNTMAITVVEAGGSTGGDTGGGTGGDTGGGTGGDSGDSYASTLTWTLGANASDAKVKVNGSSTETAALKLGTSSKAGTATLTVPAGASKISFYGLGWKGKTATLTVKLTGMTDKQAECTANEGVANNSPFTVTVAGTDKKTIDLGSALGSAATVTVTTEGSTNTRVVLFGFVSE